MTALSPTHSPTHSSPAPALRRFAVLLGWLSLFLTLALLSPGVVATANAEEAAQQAGPSCPDRAEADERTVEQLDSMVERLRAETAEAEDDGSGAVSLNTRGYNYPTGTPQDDASGH